MANHDLRRLLVLAACAALSLFAGWLFLDGAAPQGASGVDWLRAALIVIAGFWLAWGTAYGLIGMAVVSRARQALPLRGEQPLGLTVVLVPVYNEDPVATFSRLAAMDLSLKVLGLDHRFHFAVLSDTTDLTVAALEATSFERLVRTPGNTGRLFYRRRNRNIGKKAGNIEDFITRSGAAYDYAIILDADSLMEGATMAEMARRMDRDPQLGLLQTLPVIVHARSWFGRGLQFGSAFLAPAFARGLTALQGREGPFWGHNAIVRITAFAQSCGLPELSGPAPHGGHILSHDFVEAALLARNGWTVRLDADLRGSYEEGPENLIEYAKRDRRWCQGNLQHRRLLLAPGFSWWSRFNFLQGIMAYLASPLWLGLLIASLVGGALPEIERGGPGAAAVLGILTTGVLAMLIVPRLAILIARVGGGGVRRFGGPLIATASVVAEIALSSVLAPIMLMLQTRAVVQVILGIDGGWPPTSRDHSHVPLGDAFTASWWIMLSGAVALLAASLLAPDLLFWLLPAALPMIAAPLLITVSSAAPPPHSALFATPADILPSPILRHRAQVLEHWRDALELEPERVEA